MTTIRGNHSSPRVFVETGTFYGGTTERALEQFAEVHTIERDPKIHALVAPNLEALGAHCYLGDSRIEVPRLAREIQEPVLWFLDAHWFDTSYPDRSWLSLEPSPLPLWDELAAIAARPYDDVIVVDDADDFGTSTPTPEWADITAARIESYFASVPHTLAVFDNVAVVDRRC